MDIICELDTEKQCAKYPKFNKTDIPKIRVWLERTPHLPKITDHEIFLFLHSTDFSVEASKIRIDNFYTCRTHLTQYFEHRDPMAEEITYAYEVITHIVLPKKTPEGYSIIYVKMFQPSNFNMKLYMKMSNFAGEIEILCQDDDIPDGFVFLVDITGGSLAHLAQINLSELKKLMFYLTETFPAKLRGAHFINVPFPMLMDKVLSILKPMLRNDLAKEMYVHENLKSLEQYIPLECLPNDYEGGKEKSALDLTRDYQEFIIKHRNYYLEEPKHRRVNEKLRPEKMQSNMDIFGLEGNFKKLDID